MATKIQLIKVITFETIFFSCWHCYVIKILHWGGILFFCTRFENKIQLWAFQATQAERVVFAILSGV